MSNLTLDIVTADSLDVRDFTVEENVNDLYSVTVVALSPNQNIDLDSAIGMPATFTMTEGVTRTFAGICSEIRQVSVEESGLARYRVVLTPRLWLLTHRKNHRIFQFLSEVDIALQILKEWDIEPEMRLGETYKPRKYKVQYDETDFDFVNRMLEECGVSYFFKDGGGMVLCDAPQAGAPREEPLVYNATPMSGDTGYATAIQATRRLAPGIATLHDHDYRKPAGYKMKQSATAGTSVEQAIDSFDYQEGQFLFQQEADGGGKAADDRGTTRSDETAGAALARKRLAAKRFGAKEISFEARALDLAVGSVVGLNGHAREDFETDKLLLLGVTTSGNAVGEWSTTVRATLASEAFHPPMRTPRPAAFGVESAVVVGPAGEEVHCDEFGRVRVHFHWDRESQMDDKSSCWIHVNQPWSGAGYGGTMLPRVGQEVLVQFLGGDPDRPVVVGRVFTNLQPTPYSLPDNKFVSGMRSSSEGGGGGFNELMFEDKLGQELLRMRAEFDFLKRVNRDSNTSIGQDRATDVGRNETKSIGGDQRKSVQGNQTDNVFGQVVKSVAQEQLTSVAKSLGSFVGADRMMKTIGALASKAASHAFRSDVSTTLTVGKSTIFIGPEGIIIQSPKVLLNPGEEILRQATTTGKMPVIGGAS